MQLHCFYLRDGLCAWHITAAVLADMAFELFGVTYAHLMYLLAVLAKSGAVVFHYYMKDNVVCLRIAVVYFVLPFAAFLVQDYVSHPFAVTNPDFCVVKYIAVVAVVAVVDYAQFLSRCRVQSRVGEQPVLPNVIDDVFHTKSFFLVQIKYINPAKS